MGEKMDKREAGRILRSIDADTLQTARDLMNQFIPALTGGKWVSMEAGERVCYLVALALKIGERRGLRMAGRRATTGRDNPASDTDNTTQ